MMKRLLFILVFSALCFTAHAADRIVTPTGSGTACTLANPCSFNTAVIGWTAGDVINIRAGTYGAMADAGLAWPNATAGNPMVIQGYPGDAKPTFASAGDAAFAQTQTTVSNVIWRDLRFSSTGAFAEVMGVRGNNLTFENITATGNNSQTSRSGVVFLCNDVAHHITIRGGRYYDPGLDTAGGFDSPYGYPFYVHCDDLLIENVEIDNSRGYGIHLYGGPGSDRVVFRNNKIHNVCKGPLLGTCGALLVATASGAKVYGNEIYDVGTGSNDAAGIFVYSGATNTEVYNNTVSSARFGIAYYFQSGMIAKNNLLYNNGQNWYDPLGEAVTRSNNGCDPNDGDTTGCSVVTASPGFMNAGAFDFRLALGSVMENAGVNVGLPCNGGCAIGAYDPPVLTLVDVGTAGSNKITLTFDADASQPLRTTSSFSAGWTALKAGANNPVLSASLVGNAVIELTTQNNFLSTDSCSVSYVQASGGLTDSVLIGNITNQPFLSRSTVPCVNNVTGTGATVAQLSYKFRELYGTETAAGWKTTAENTPYDVIVGGAVRLRMKFKAETATPPAFNAGFQKRITLPGLAAGSKTTLGNTCSPTELVCFFGTGTALGVTHNTPTTEQLTSTMANVAGAVLLTNSTPNIAPGVNTEWEMEIAVKLDPTLPKGSIVEIFGTRDGGAVFESYPANAIATIRVIDNQFVSGF